MLLYRLRPTRARLLRAARPLLTELEDPAFGPAVRQLGAVYRHLRLDAGLPRTATEEELGDFGGPVAVFASEEDAFFPARAVLPRAEEIFPNLVMAERLEGCRHVPSKAAFRRVNERVLAFLAAEPDGTWPRPLAALGDPHDHPTESGNEAPCRSCGGTGLLGA
jgi:hypothetical protein